MLSSFLFLWQQTPQLWPCSCHRVQFSVCLVRGGGSGGGVGTGGGRDTERVWEGACEQWCGRWGDHLLQHARFCAGLQLENWGRNITFTEHLLGTMPNVKHAYIYVYTGRQRSPFFCEEETEVPRGSGTYPIFQSWCSPRLGWLQRFFVNNVKVSHRKSYCLYKTVLPAERTIPTDLAQRTTWLGTDL